MSTEIFTYQEYKGPEIPNLPFPAFHRKAEAKMPEDFPDIYQKNVKVFERDLEKRKVILETFLASGFTLLADHLTPNGTIVEEYDRLVFSS
mgnify:CR=1 FL=1